MKRFLFNGLWFALFGVIFYLALLIFWVELIPGAFRPNASYKVGAFGHLRSRIEEINYYENVDVLFLGSSHAYRGFDTRIFNKSGIKTFNLGSSSQTPVQTQVLLSRYVNVLNPKTVVYEVYPETFMLDGVESSIDLLANDRNDWRSVEMSMTIGSINVFNSLFYAFVADWTGRNDKFVEPRVQGGDQYISGGYVEREVLEYCTPSRFDSKMLYQKYYQWVVFEEIVKSLKARGIKVILVFAPVTKYLYESYSNVEAFDSLMAASAEYYNFNEILSLEDTIHFYDYHHLNQRGVELFNRKFLETVWAK